MRRLTIGFVAVCAMALLASAVVAESAADREVRRRGARAGRGRPARGGDAQPFIDSKPVPKSDAEKKILSVLEDMDKNQRRGMMNVPVEDARVLRLLTEAVGAKHVVEIGTSNGYSGIWFCLALRATGGKLYGPGGSAELLGLNPNTLRSRMKKLGLGGARSHRAGQD